MQTSKSYTPAPSGDIGSLKLNCFSFLQNEMIPSRYTLDGININPAIYIEEIPDTAKSFAIIVEDPDVPHDSFCHWVAWNIPVTHHIKEKENRGIFGINDFGNHGYNGPHPFSIIHRYFFKVYALDCFLNIPISSTRTELKKAMKDHLVGFGVLIGKYKKQELQKAGHQLRARQIHVHELKALFDETGLCVSITLPLSHNSTDETTDKYYLQKTIKETCILLMQKNLEGTTQIINTLKKLQEEILIHPSDKGLGIYVSNELTLYTGFPFEVSEKIIVHDRFHLKDILVKEQYSALYNVLYIDEKEMRLYNGKLNQLNEVKNKELPMSFEDENDEQTSINGFFARNSYNRANEKTVNESALNKYRSVLQKADEVLSPYLQNSDGVVLCGMRRYISEFMNTTRQAEKLISILYGNYNRFTEIDFSEMVWPIVKTYIEQEMSDEINEFNRKIAEGRTEEGISHVWDAVLTDRGATLLVEKSFEIGGYVEPEDPLKLYLHEPRNPHSVLPDAVDEIIRIALNKEVKIVFVEDGMLNRNMRIALITKF